MYEMNKLLTHNEICRNSAIKGLWTLGLEFGKIYTVRKQGNTFLSQ